MNTPTSTSIHDSRTIHFHWISAGLILTLWLLGQTIDFFPKDAPRILARSTHITLGALLVVVYVLRMQWRATRGTRLPPLDPGVLGRVAVGVHHLLYLILGVTLVAGIITAWIRGDNLFLLGRIPALIPGETPWRETSVDIHGLLANSLLGLASVHGLAALWHHWIRQDLTLQRMWPRCRLS